MRSFIDAAIRSNSSPSRIDQCNYTAGEPQHRIGVWLLERIKNTVFEIAQAWRQPPPSKANNPKRLVVARTASVGVMLVDVNLISWSNRPSRALGASLSLGLIGRMLK